MLLDSPFLLDLLAGEPDALGKYDELEDERLSVSALTVYGVSVGLSGRNRRRLYDIMDRLTVRPFDAVSASRAVAEQRELIDQGERVGTVDAMIGATTLSTQESVLTVNVREFERLGCTVERY